MEIAKDEVQAVKQLVEKEMEARLEQLSLLELALVGGGSGDIHLS